MNNSSSENSSPYGDSSYFYKNNYRRTIKERKKSMVVIINNIREKNSKIAPGLYETIDLMCKIKYGKEYIVLFFEKPDKLKEMLITRYGNEYIASIVIRYTLLRPFLYCLGLEELEDELYNLLMVDPLEFKSKIGELLEIVYK